MKTYLDFVKALPQWVIPVKFLKDKDVIEILIENVEFAIKEYERPVYERCDAIRYVDNDEVVTSGGFYLCVFCNTHLGFGLLERCIKVTLSDCSISIDDRCYDFDKDYAVYAISIDLRRNVRLYWLKQLKEKLNQLKGN